MFRKGDYVRVSRDNDNDCYDEFRYKRLKITGVYGREHPGYDESMRGMRLYEFIDDEGNNVPCALYEYEIEKY